MTGPGNFNGGLQSEVITEFVRAYPLIHVDVTLTGRWVNLIEEGFDLALRAGKLRDSTLVARKIAASELGLYAAPAYLKRRGQPKRLAELAHHDCLLYRSGQGLMPWRLAGPRGAELVTVKGPVTSDSLSFIQDLAAKAAGIALLPDQACAAEVARGALVRILPAYAIRGGALHIVSPPLRHVPARVALLRDYLLKELPRRMGAAS